EVVTLHRGSDDVAPLGDQIRTIDSHNVSLRTQSNTARQSTFNYRAVPNKLTLLARKLAAQVELLQHFLIAIRVALTQIVEQRAALAHHLQQAAARVLVLFVLLQMLG